MLPYFELVDFHLGSWAIRVWGIFVSLAFIIGLWLATREATRRRPSPERIIDLTIWIIFAAMIGARVFYVWNEWDLFRSDFLAGFKIWDGGLTMYGGMMGGAIATWIFCWRRRLATLAYFDVIAYVMPLAIAIGRVGCFLIHDHLGQITTFWLGIKMPDGTIRHDLALYEIIFGVILFLFFSWWRRKPLASGLMTAGFIMAYGGFRLAFDFLRATDLPLADPTVWFGLHPSQIVAIISLWLAVGWLIYHRKKLSR